ncbi:hypothetical protein PV939_11815, partial [Ligilactobacillus salivarius]|nr:hypothetical protein [Ligilactobacillus salivarius]
RVCVRVWRVIHVFVCFFVQREPGMRIRDCIEMQPLSLPFWGGERNQGREMRPSRKWIQSGKTFDAKLLIDENIALKSL